ncbi:DEAD box ATP-dependent RNA helicase, putative [Schistosoma mansoni]|uniref:DEAD box ATP-dependent RNA helicase, putative n=1 Tax=Schistosoma mansoni TaxID=6183 RepID=UPI00022C831D|nr:DEAD box ATP-dependent RNA helicase, putative [Schistosoma mansoni]|eukprot:XP_018645293.1 DEAD box ATP-dependent RNA helicase, putative [Schistosoma mansoni]
MILLMNRMSQRVNLLVNLNLIKLKKISSVTTTHSMRILRHVLYVLNYGLRQDHTKSAVFVVDIFSAIRMCVMKWFKSVGKKAKCPQCNAKANRRDIRVLYCKNLKVLDTTDRDRALAELEREKRGRQKAEQEAAEFKARCDLLHAQVLQLRDELQTTKGLPKVQSSLLQNTSEISNYKASRQCGNCRVMASCDYLNTLCVSQSSTNPIFRGFGIRKVNSSEQRLIKYVHLHTQPIRDLAFHPEAHDGIIASASLDKTLRLTSLLNIVQTYHCPVGIWSCCWAGDSNRLFAGCANGSIMLYDIRVTTGPIDVFYVPNNDAPVLGLQYLSPAVDQNISSAGGLLVGQLNKVTFMSESPENPIAIQRTTNQERIESADGIASTDDSENPASPDILQDNSTLRPSNWLGNIPSYKPHNLPLEGSLVSLSALPQGRQFLASYRPSQRLPRVRHLLAELQSETSPVAETAYSCREIHNLWAGNRMKKLTRAKLFVGPSKESGLIAVAGNEDVNGALIWRCSDGTQMQVLQPPETTADSPILDVCPIFFASTQSHCLTLLTDRMLHFYMWRTQNSY